MPDEFGFSIAAKYDGFFSLIAKVNNAIDFATFLRYTSYTQFTLQPGHCIFVAIVLIFNDNYI